MERDLAATHGSITDAVRGAHYEDYVHHHAARSRYYESGCIDCIHAGLL